MGSNIKNSIVLSRGWFYFVFRLFVLIFIIIIPKPILLIKIILIAVLIYYSITNYYKIIFEDEKIYFSFYLKNRSRVYLYSEIKEVIFSNQFRGGVILYIVFVNGMKKAHAVSNKSVLPSLRNFLVKKEIKIIDRSILE